MYTNCFLGFLLELCHLVSLHLGHSLSCEYDAVKATQLLIQQSKNFGVIWVIFRNRASLQRRLGIGKPSSAKILRRRVYCARGTQPDHLASFRKRLGFPIWLSKSVSSLSTKSIGRLPEAPNTSSRTSVPIVVVSSSSSSLVMFVLLLLLLSSSSSSRYARSSGCAPAKASSISSSSISCSSSPSSTTCPPPVS